MSINSLFACQKFSIIIYKKYLQNITQNIRKKRKKHEKTRFWAKTQDLMIHSLLDFPQKPDISINFYVLSIKNKKNSSRMSYILCKNIKNNEKTRFSCPLPFYWKTAFFWGRALFLPQRILGEQPWVPCFGQPENLEDSHL